METSFLPGRTFDSLEDMNRQALEWASDRMYHRPVSKTGLIPAKAFEHERAYLTELPSQLVAPYTAHERSTDQYGYTAFAGNYYWVPGGRREQVKLLQYAERLKIFQQRTCLLEYQLPADGVKNERFSPAGGPSPRHLPKHRKNGSMQEEKRLRAMGGDVEAYLDYALKTAGLQRHRFLRKLFALSRRVTEAVFARTLQRALRYRVTHIETLQRIAWFCISQSDQQLPEVEVDDSFRERPAYQEGCLTDEPDLSIYDDLLPDDDESDNDAGSQPGKEQDNG